MYSLALAFLFLPPKKHGDVNWQYHSSPNTSLQLTSSLFTLSLEPDSGFMKKHLCKESRTVEETGRRVIK